MKKKYIPPEYEIEKFTIIDIVTSSTEGWEEGDEEIEF